jgi:hypothetical protein
MQHKLLASLLASSSLLSFAACGGDDGNVTPEYDADFASADDAHLMRALGAGIGMDAKLAHFTVAGYASFPIDDDTGLSCPTFARSGDQVTVTGGCTMDDGTRIEGRIIYSNVAPIFPSNDYDPSKPTSITFEDYSMEDDDGLFAYDGTLRIEPSGATSANLTVTMLDITVRSKLEVTCADGECTVDDDSWIDVDDLGGARVEGTWPFDATMWGGAVTLRGAQVLEMDTADATGDCLPYSLDGVEKMICR